MTGPRLWPSDYARLLFRARNWSRRGTSATETVMRTRDPETRRGKKGKEGENRDDHRGRQRRSPPTRSGPAHAPAPRETAARESSRAAPPAACRWDCFIRGAGPGPAPLAPTQFGLPGWVEIRAGATHGGSLYCRGTGVHVGGGQGSWASAKSLIGTALSPWTWHQHLWTGVPPGLVKSSVSPRVPALVTKHLQATWHQALLSTGETSLRSKGKPRTGTALEEGI